MVAGSLSGKVAIVTGAGNPHGIGVTTARTLAREGARIVLVDLESTPVHDSAATLKDEGFEVAARAVDISDESQAKALMAFTRDLFGRLDILDNNAAYHGDVNDGDVLSMTVELWDKIMSVNARGAMLMCKHALPLMIAQGGGSIINISSGTAQGGDFYATAYAASKGAINTFTKYVATQYGAQGIRCNAIAPGIIMTEALLNALDEPAREVFRNHSLTQQLGQPADIAEMVAFLASDKAQFVTGQILGVDGGIFAHIPTAFEARKLFGA
ncbi:MAG TPA: SDR family oxidoreductase [Rhizorhapis sp.]